MDLPDAIEVIRPSVEQIKYGNTSGSGVVIARDHVATAYHVVEAAVNRAVPGAELTVLAAIANKVGPGPGYMLSNFFGGRARVIAADPVADVAVLEVARGALENVPFVFAGPDGNGPVSPPAKPAAIEKTILREGEAIATSGYPLSSPALVTTPGTIAALLYNVPAGANLPELKYHAALTVNPGNSGGPVYRVADGTLVGICIAFSNSMAFHNNQPYAPGGSPVVVNSGLGIVTPIEKVVALVPQLGL